MNSLANHSLIVQMVLHAEQSVDSAFQERDSSASMHKKMNGVKASMKVLAKHSLIVMTALFAQILLKYQLQEAKHALRFGSGGNKLCNAD